MSRLMCELCPDPRHSVIHATQRHLIWDVTREAWVEADDLVRGDLLLSADGMLVKFSSAVIVPGSAYMWDLTVQGDHDFYIVDASAATFLVHNCPSSTPEAARARETPDAQALRNLANEVKGKGISRDDAETMNGWRKEVMPDEPGDTDTYGHGIATHSRGGTFGRIPHIDILNIHIKIL